MSAPRNSVVVGVSEDSVDAALSFAADEARRAQRPLHLVHVAPLPSGDAYVQLRREILHAARVAIEKAQQTAEELAGPSVSVTTEVVDSRDVVDGLTENTGAAYALVLQHRALSRTNRFVGGSVAQSTAGRAAVRVISVPEGWTPRDDRPPVVTVCVQDQAEAPALLRTALEEARARAGALVVLHAWWLSSGFDVVAVDQSYRDEYAADWREDMASFLAPLRTEFPDVEVAVEVQHQPPVEAVLDAAERSDLLLLGRRHHLLPWGSHLGPLARAAIGHAACPVLIHPEVSVMAQGIPYSERLAAIVEARKRAEERA